jgi:benzylsuccinate CoA-transferase BbsF subunit
MEKRILEGIRILELGPLVALPLSGRILASLGAEVIKLETNRVPDLMNFVPPWSKGMGQPEFQALKRRITLDLRVPEGQEVFKELVKISDVFMTNFREDILARWGIPFQQIREIKPDIIILFQTAMGDGGPYEGYKIYGIFVQNAAGVSMMSGFPGSAPYTVNNSYSDYHTGIFQPMLLIGALERRRRTGQGSFIATSIFSSGVCTIGPAILDYQCNGRLPERIGNKDPFAAPHGIYPCQGEDEWCAIAVFNDQEWESFCKVIGNPLWAKAPKFSTLLERIKNADELDRLIGEWTSNHSKEEVMKKMQSAGVPAGIVAKGKDLSESAHLKERSFYQETTYYVTEPGKPGNEWQQGPDVAASRIPISFSETPCLSGPYKRMGEDNEYVYGQLLNMSPGKIKELTEKEIFY